MAEFSRSDLACFDKRSCFVGMVLFSHGMVELLVSMGGGSPLQYNSEHIQMAQALRKKGTGAWLSD